MRKYITLATAAILLTACGANTAPEGGSSTQTADLTIKDSAGATTPAGSVVSDSATSRGDMEATTPQKIEGAESYIRKMNKNGVPCFIDGKDNSLHIELMESVSGDYNDLANYTLREAIKSGVKGISCCKVYLDRELVGEAKLEEK
ncbi:MAG: hypothetical protein J5875_02435 [Paludibacteraceae bacterium]|nr:hypothetical protein [Paludibacteraceae bacterium]